MRNISYFILTENSNPNKHANGQNYRVICFPRTRVDHISTKGRGNVIKNGEPVEKEGSIVEQGLNIGHTTRVLSPIFK